MGTGSTIYYDPSAWPREGDPNSPTSAEQLDQALAMSEEMRNGQVPPGSQGESYKPPGGGGGGGSGGGTDGGGKFTPGEGKFTPGGGGTPTQPGEGNFKW
jgi:hypothetical protein